MCVAELFARFLNRKSVPCNDVDHPRNLSIEGIATHRAYTPSSGPSDGEINLEDVAF
ncbi:MAG: hypothetical protein QOJ64_4438 [Acidobacteriota bacterium]|nr:hypothetical protein [Acidobacteriota bacterium]